MLGQFKYYLDYLVEQCLKNKVGNRTCDGSIREIRLKYLCFIIGEEVRHLEDALPLHKYPGASLLGLAGKTTSGFHVPPLRQVKMGVGIILPAGTPDDVRTLLMNGEAMERTVVMEASATFSNKVMLTAQMKKVIMLTPSFNEMLFWGASGSPLCAVNRDAIIFIGRETDFMIPNVCNPNNVSVGTAATLDFTTTTVGSGLQLSPFAPLPYTGSKSMFPGASQGLSSGVGPYSHLPGHNMFAPSPPWGSGEDLFRGMIAMDMSQRINAVPPMHEHARGIDRSSERIHMPPFGIRSVWDIGGPTGALLGENRRPLAYCYSDYEKGLINDSAKMNMPSCHPGLIKPLNPIALRPSVSVSHLTSEPVAGSSSFNPEGKPAFAVASGSSFGLLGRKGRSSSKRGPDVSTDNLRSAAAGPRSRSMNGQFKGGKGPGAKNAGFRKVVDLTNETSNEMVSVQDIMTEKIDNQLTAEYAPDFALKQESFYHKMLSNARLNPQERGYFQSLLDKSRLTRGCRPLILPYAPKDAGSLYVHSNENGLEKTAVSIILEKRKEAGGEIVTVNLENPARELELSTEAENDDLDGNKLFISELEKELDVEIDVISNSAD